MATNHALTPAQIAADLRIRSRTAPRTHVPRSDSGPPHCYFTDGVNLYRFVGWVNRSVNAMLAELEDCRSLDVLLVSAEDLGRSTLRPISCSSGT